MIERFERDESFGKLRRATWLGTSDKYEIFKLAEILMNGPEGRAFNAAKDELVKTTKSDEQLSYNHPKVMELMNLETGLELDKITLQVSELPADFTPEDMMTTSWIIEYKGNTKA